MFLVLTCTSARGCLFRVPNPTWIILALAAFWTTEEHDPGQWEVPDEKDIGYGTHLCTDGKLGDDGRGGLLKRVEHERQRARAVALVQQFLEEQLLPLAGVLLCRRRHFSHRRPGCDTSGWY